MTEFVTIAVFIQTILALLVGYALGKGKLTAEEAARIQTAIKRKIDPVRVGAVKRPSAEQLRTWADPKKAAEEAEMLRVLKDIPDIQPKG